MDSQEKEVEIMEGNQQKYIAYLVRRAPNSNSGSENNTNNIAIQQEQIESFIGTRNVLLDTYFEKFDKKRKRFPMLSQAIAACREAGATLLIAELQSLTPYAMFTSRLLESELDFVALDLTEVTRLNLGAVSEYAQKRREQHRHRIIQGLAQTEAKLGNPNALKEIAKVNKPKTENAIIFALMLQPIVMDLQQKGFSQRKIVQTLNDSGCTAPEGGRWVLSQLQKVLERIKLNDSALGLIPFFEKHADKAGDVDALLQQLIGEAIPAPNKQGWDRDTVCLVQERIGHIRDILELNEFILNVLPVVIAQQAEGRSSSSVVDILNQRQVSIPQRIRWDAEMCGHEDAATVTLWDVQLFDLAINLAKRRQQMILGLKSATLQQAARLLGMPELSAVNE